MCSASLAQGRWRKPARAFLACMGRCRSAGASTANTARYCRTTVVQCTFACCCHSGSIAANESIPQLITQHAAVFVHAPAHHTTYHHGSAMSYEQTLQTSTRGDRVAAGSGEWLPQWLADATPRPGQLPTLLGRAGQAGAGQGSRRGLGAACTPCGATTVHTTPPPVGHPPDHPRRCGARHRHSPMRCRWWWCLAVRRPGTIPVLPPGGSGQPPPAR